MRASSIEGRAGSYLGFVGGTPAADLLVGATLWQFGLPGKRRGSWDAT